MRKIVLAAAIAGAALSLAACSESTGDAAEETVDNAMADAEANAEAAGEVVEGAAADAGEAVEDVADGAEGAVAPTDAATTAAPAE